MDSNFYLFKGSFLWPVEVDINEWGSIDGIWKIICVVFPAGYHIVHKSGWGYAYDYLKNKYGETVASWTTSLDKNSRMYVLRIKGKIVYCKY